MSSSTDARAGQRRATLVVGHDRHRAARAALRTAIDLARELGAELHVVHTSTLDDYGIDPDTEQFEAAHDRALAAERAEITRLLDGGDIAWVYHEQTGDPSHALADLAGKLDARMIVVGAAHARGVHHLLGGEPVAKHLLRRQHRPVLVVPEPPG